MGSANVHAHLICNTTIQNTQQFFQPVSVCKALPVYFILDLNYFLLHLRASLEAKYSQLYGVMCWAYRAHKYSMVTGLIP